MCLYLSLWGMPQKWFALSRMLLGFVGDLGLIVDIAVRILAFYG